MSSISSNSIKKFLEQVTRFFYDRRIVNESGARQLVESIASPGDIIAYGCETHIIKYDKNKGTFETIPMPHDIGIFTSSMSIGSIENSIAIMLPKSSMRQFANYSLEFGEEKKKLRIPVTNSISIGAITDRSTNNSYFDLVAYLPGTREKCRVINYSNRSGGQLTHSGDQISASILSHTLTVGPTAEDFVVGMVGYQMKKLYTFTNQNPIILYFNHDTKVITIIPLSLDRVTVGDSTMAMLTHNKIVSIDGSIYLEVSIISPRTMEHVDTNHCGPDIASLLSDVMNERPEIIESASASADSLSASTPLITEEVPVSEDYNNIRIFQFTDSSNCIPDISSRTIQFHSSDANLKLPIVFDQQLEGHPSVLLGRFQSQFFLELEQMNISHVIVNLTPEDWNYKTNEILTNKGNCLFIIYLSHEEFAKINTLELYCLEMAGPRAIILYVYSSKYYYYRGVQQPGFPVQESGSEVEDFNGKLSIWINSDITYPVLSAKNNTSIYIDPNTIVTVEQILAMELAQITDIIRPLLSQQAIIFDIMTQLEHVCDANSLREVSEKLTKVFAIISSEYDTTMIEKIRDAYTLGDTELMSLLINERRQTQSFDKIYKLLLQKLNNMISQKNVYSKQASLERIQRKITISKNVERVASMTSEQIFKEIGDECSQAGFAIVTVNFPIVNNILQECGRAHRDHDQNTFLDPEVFISQTIDMYYGSLGSDSRWLSSDPETIGTIKEVTENYHRDFAGSINSLTLPYYGNSGNTFMVIPLLDEFVSLTDPTQTDWKDKTNDTVIASFRIAMRSTFIEAITSRELNIPKDSTLLGCVICMLVLDYLESLTSNIHSPPEEGSNILEIIRGSLGFLLTLMSSGQNSQLKVWELFSTNKQFSSPSDPAIWKIYKRVMKIAYLARWINHSVLTRYQKISFYYAKSIYQKIRSEPESIMDDDVVV